MIRYVLRRIIRVGLGFCIFIAYKAYNVEGINALLLVMPAKMIAPMLRQYGATIGTGIQIHSPLIIHNASNERGKHYSNLIVGDYCYIGRDVFFDLKEQVILEDHVTISMRCTIITHTDAGMRPPDEDVMPSSSAPVKIEHGAYLGACSTVLEGVTVGDRSIVAAGALVRRNVQSRETVAGIPARSVHAPK